MSAQSRVEPGEPPIYTTIRYQQQRHIGMLTLARPEKHNAQNPLMWDELGQLGDELLAVDDLRCLIVTGEGSTFSAGLDVTESMALLTEAIARSDEEALAAFGRSATRALGWIPELDCGSTAAVRGHAYGAGLQLALACDFRVFAQGTKVGLLEMRYGILPDMGATVRLPRIIGESRARELILLGDVIDSEQALRIGLANQVVGAGDLDVAAGEFARRLGAQPPLAVRGARRAIDAAWHHAPQESLMFASDQQRYCLLSEDFKEARRALGEGRSPQWCGR